MSISRAHSLPRSEEGSIEDQIARLALSEEEQDQDDDFAQMFNEDDSRASFDDYGRPIDFEDDLSQRPEVRALQAPQTPQKNILEARVKLEDRISQDRETNWKDENTWDQQENYTTYRKEVEEILQNEKRFLAPTPTDSNPLNFLQHVLKNASTFRPYELRLDKAKFLLRLIKDVDEAQLRPKWGPKPLHAAAVLDISLLKNDKGAKADITLYMSKLIGSDAAAKEICEVNEAKENIIHLAIRHELKGLEHFIEVANKAAFRQQRVSQRDKQVPQIDDGNMPLHDAVDYAKFRVQGPSCPTQTTAKTTKGSTKSSTTIEPPGKASTRAQDPTLGMCLVCKKTYGHAASTGKTIKRIVDRLLERDKSVLALHNSAGLSPYSYLQAGHQRSEEGRSLSVSISKGVVTERRDERRDSKLEDGIMNQNPDLLVAEKKELERKQEGKRPQQYKPFPQKEGSSKGSTNDVGNRNVWHTQREEHKFEDLEISSKVFDFISDTLKKSSFTLGGYSNAYRCLFRDQSVQSLYPLDGELDRQRKFHLEGKQRVSAYTKENFNFLLFEPTMASVVLSLRYTQEDMRRMPSDEQNRLSMWREDQQNLRDIFEWLKKDKKVKTILSLTVKDNLDRYCSDDTVEKCLKGLEVLYLDWKRPNLCANTSTLPKNLVEISLYWAGLNAILWSWSDTGGLQTLEKLQKIHLYVQRGIELPDEQDAKVQAFKKRIEKWKRDSKPVVNVAPDDQVTKGTGQGSDRITSSDILKHSWFEVASVFGKSLLSNYRGPTTGSERHRVKVALLDDGVDPTFQSIGYNLHHAGWPSVDPGEMEAGSQSFYVSTNQHGSKMAWLIREVCPFVTLYVAKLDVQNSKDLRQRSLDLKQAIEAIKWATAQKVDVISMSWNVRQVPGATGNDTEIRKLQTAIDNAAVNGILMFAAACDVKESSSLEKWYPCDCNNVSSIGATDMDYDAKKYVDTTKKVDYLFPGEHLLGQPEDSEVGNSGATALAAGLAALVLYCMKVEDEELPYAKRQWMDNIMRKVFNSETNNRVVHVKDVLQMEKGGGLKTLVQKFASQRG